MDGTLTHYLPSKGYGFIRGDDGRDYFAHHEDFGSTAPADGLRVRFDENVTPKGYRARAIQAIVPAAANQYTVPDEILQTRDAELRDWELIEASPWRIHGSSRESPEHARIDLRYKAHLLGANGLVLVQYYKTRGSEQGTGSGRHYYTIHNYHAHPVTVARRHAQGAKRREELEGLDTRIRQVKTGLVARTRTSSRNAWQAALGLFVAVPVGAAVIGELSIRGGSLLMVAAIACILAAAAFMAIRRDHDSWLEPLHAQRNTRGEGREEPRLD